MAFVRRDFLTWISYRLSVAGQVLGLFLILGLVYFAGTAIGDKPHIISQESGSYVAFVLAGITFTDVFSRGMSYLPASIRAQQSMGTLEPMMAAPVSGLSLALSTWLFQLVLSVFRAAFFLGFGVLVLGYWGHINPISLVMVVVPAMLAFLAFGMMSTAFIILAKQGDPIIFAFGALTFLLGGVIYPVDALPGWVQVLSALTPLTHGLEGVRKALSGSPPGDVLPEAAVLALMAAVLLPIAITGFNLSLRRAKQEGALGDY
jgi:ABC-2 type transport system permease protein